MSCSMDPKTDPLAKPIRLDFTSVMQVVVTPENKDRFVTTSKEAAHACKVAEDSKAWGGEFDQFLMFVHEWCAQYAHEALKCFVGVSDEGLTVFVVTKGAEYNFGFDDAITALNLEIADKFPSISANAIQVPNVAEDNLASFVSLPHAIQVHG